MTFTPGEVPFDWSQELRGLPPIGDGDKALIGCCMIAEAVKELRLAIESLDCGIQTKLVGSLQKSANVLGNHVMSAAGMLPR